jgi:sulfonate transport system permease protein
MSHRRATIVLAPPMVPSVGSAAVRRPTAADVAPGPARRSRRRKETLLALGVPVLVIALWQLTADLGMLDSRFFPAPEAIARAAGRLAIDGVLLDHLWVSTRRVLLGFLLGCGLGVLTGILVGASQWIRAATEPLTYALFTVPKLALLPLFLLIFGIGETPIILLIAINCFFLVEIPTMLAIATVPTQLTEVARSFGSTRLQMMRHVRVPYALPQIFVALRLSAGAAILVLVGAEFVQGRTGIGFLIWNSWSLFLADQMYVGIVTVAIMGALFTVLVSAIGRFLTPWTNTG